MIMNKEYDFNNIIAHFLIDGELLDCERYGEGHINDTFRITVGQGEKSVHYILQRINHRLFTDVDKLMHNIGLVTEFCRNSVEREGGDPMRECLNIVRTREGKAYYFDGSNYFRVYVFIENATTHQTVRHSRDFYESAVAFGKFVRLLADFDASQLYELLPGFHNTKVRYADFLRAVEKDSCNRRAEIAGEVRPGSGPEAHPASVNIKNKLISQDMDRFMRHHLSFLLDEGSMQNNPARIAVPKIAPKGERRLARRSNGEEAANDRDTRLDNAIGQSVGR